MAKNEPYRPERHASQRGTLRPATRTGHDSYLGWILGFEKPLLVRTTNQSVPTRREEERNKK